MLYSFSRFESIPGFFFFMKKMNKSLYSKSDLSLIFQAITFELNTVIAMERNNILAKLITCSLINKREFYYRFLVISDLQLLLEEYV